MTDFNQLRREKELINLRESARYSWREGLEEATDHPYVDVMPNEKTGDPKKDKKKEDKKEKVEEGWKPLPQDKIMRQSHKAYRKEEDAVKRGDQEGATKQMKRRFAMEAPSSRKAALDNKKAKKKEMRESLSLNPNTAFRLDEDAVSSGAFKAVADSLPDGVLIDPKKKKKEIPWHQKHLRKDPTPNRYDKKND